MNSGVQRNHTIRHDHDTELNGMALMDLENSTIEVIH